MADTVGDREEEWERRFRKMEARIENLYAMNDRLLARRDRDSDGKWWHPVLLGIALFLGIVALAKFI